mmetsp:Transcript_1053/g.2174  ORF Transcript_1053/g.2174 Transcript_1053/m.2174 type:complete len:224 (+) Transcript_1053:668-1339(+)
MVALKAWSEVARASPIKCMSLESLLYPSATACLSKTCRCSDATMKLFFSAVATLCAGLRGHPTCCNSRVARALGGEGRYDYGSISMLKRQTSRRLRTIARSLAGDDSSAIKTFDKSMVEEATVVPRTRSQHLSPPKPPPYHLGHPPSASMLYLSRHFGPTPRLEVANLGIGMLPSLPNHLPARHWCASRPDSFAPDPTLRSAKNKPFRREARARTRPRRPRRS